MKRFTIPRDDAPSLTFTGELFAAASTSPDQAMPNYSGSVGRWQELKLYKTAGGQYICQRVNRTQWDGEHDDHDAIVAGNDIANVIEFFGHGRLAKELYESADIDDVEPVE